MREGVAPVSAKGFYNHFANGEHGQRMYDDVNFIRGIEIVSEIDKLIAANDDSINRCDIYRGRCFAVFQYPIDAYLEEKVKCDLSRFEPYKT